jgi:signal peptidase I
MLLALARFIDFPLSMSMVAGKSMEPHLLVGDLVLSVKGNYDVGDVVVIGGVNKINCIVHRIVNMTEEYVVTKGDANPGPDGPIGRDHVLYKVIYVIPRLLWIPPLLAVLLFIGFRYLKELIQGAEVGRTLITVVLFFSILDLVYMSLIPIYHVHQQIELKKPNVQLRSISISDDFRFFTAVYTNVEVLRFIRVNWAAINAAGREFIPENVSIDGDALVVGIPNEVYEALYANSSGASSFWVYCDIALDKGNLYGYYPITFSWRKLEVNVVNNTVLIFNPNPVSLNASFEIQYYDLDSFGRLYHVRTNKFNTALHSLSSFTVRPEKTGVTCYVILRYVLLNQNVMESRKVNPVGD